MKSILLLTVFSLAVMGVAHAEKADSEKEAVITARSGHVDDIKQVRTLTGGVVLVEGTLTVKAGRALITEDPQGYQFITFWGEAGKLATFRQKRDGEGDLWVEGEAERVEYNNKGLAVRVYRPYFANHHRYINDESFRLFGYCDQQFYDPLGRPTQTITASGYRRRQTYLTWYSIAEDGTWKPREN